MRYHTTTTTIIVSCIVLALCVLLVAGGMSLLGLQDPASQIASELIGRLDSDGDVRIVIGSMDRGIWRALVAKDISLEVRDGDTGWWTIATIDSVSLDHSLQRLVLSLFGRNKTLGINVSGLAFHLDEQDFKLFNSLLASSSQEVKVVSDDSSTSSLLDKFTYDIRLTDSFGSIAFGDDHLSIDGIVGTLTIEPGLSITNASLSASTITCDIATTKGLLEATVLSLQQKNDSYACKAQVKQLSVEADQYQVQVSDLALSSVLSSLNITSLDAVLVTYQSGTIKASFDKNLATIPSIQGSLSLLEHGTWDASLSLPSFVGNLEIFDQMLVVDSPAMILSANGYGFSEIDLSMRIPQATEGLGLYHGTEELVALQDVFSRINFDLKQHVLKGQLHWQKLDLANLQGFSPFFGDFSIPISSFASDNSQVNFSLTDSYKRFGVELYSEVQIDTKLEVPQQIKATILSSFDYDTADSDSNLFVDLTELTADGIPGSTDLHYSWKRNVSESLMSLQADNSVAGIGLDATYNLLDHQLVSMIKFNEFKPALFEAFVGNYAPIWDSYFDKETRIVGNIQVDAVPGVGTVFGLNGRVSFELGVIDLKVGSRRFNGATTFAGTLTDDHVDVETFTATTEGYRVSYHGGLYLENFLPEGELVISTTEGLKQLLRIDFNYLPPESYSFVIDSEFAPSIKLTGKMNWQSGRIINSTAMLDAWNMSYPISLTLNLNTMSLMLLTDRLSLSAMLNDDDTAWIRIKGDEFQLPRFSQSLSDAPVLVSGTTNFSLPLDTYAWSIGISGFEVQNLPATEGVGTVSFDLHLDDRELDIANIVWDSGQMVPLKGFFYLNTDSLKKLISGDMSGFKAVSTLSSSLGESVQLSLYSTDSDNLDGLLDISSFDLARVYLPLQDMTLTTSFVGGTDFANEISVSGDVLVESKLQIEDPMIISSSINLDSSTFTLTEMQYSKGNVSLYDGNLSLSFDSGYFDSSIAASFILENKDKPREFSGSFFSSSTLPLSGGFFNIQNSLDVMLDLIKDFSEPEQSDALLSASFGFSDVILGDEYRLPDSSYELVWSGKRITIDGGQENGIRNIVGYYDLHDGSIDLVVDPSLLIGFHAQGTVTPKHIMLRVFDIDFPLPLINITFMKPIVWFYEGQVHGDIWITGDPLAPDFYGMAWADRVDASTFWLPDDILSMKNPVITIEEGYASSSLSTLTSTNLKTGNVVQGLGKASCNLDGWILEDFQLDAKITDGLVYVWIPILGMGLDIKGYGNGDIVLYGSGGATWISGPVYVENTDISFGVSGLPQWYTSSGKASSDLEIVTGKNVNFYFPTADSPIISATIDEGQKASFSYNHETERVNANGYLGFRSGEIYYFQKNFYITEGSLQFRTDAFTQTIVPVINLRARIRDFDANGNKVDIYLVLQDSTLDNLAPRFESVPSLPTNEILEILGQSILPTSAYGQFNVSSIASLAATATDVISRLGIIDTGSSGLSNSIKSSLGLDMFTLRSNIVQNILFDVLPGTSLVSSTASPLARYLDNTTISLGKYLNRDFFLQGMIHFSAAPDGKTKGFFLANDLEVDIELSVEWANPMCTFSLFTQPDELSLFNILDTIGFSVTKRIVF